MIKAFKELVGVCSAVNATMACPPPCAAAFLPTSCASYQVCALSIQMSGVSIS
jgi:hypothetical protein